MQPLVLKIFLAYSLSGNWLIFALAPTPTGLLYRLFVADAADRYMLRGTYFLLRRSLAEAEETVSDYIDVILKRHLKIQSFALRPDMPDFREKRSLGAGAA